MSVPMHPDDPAYWMLTDPNIIRKAPLFHREGCFICEDPEFAMMGLPLCYECKVCKGHVPADDCICSDCGVDQRPEEQQQEA